MILSSSSSLSSSLKKIKMPQDSENSISTPLPLSTAEDSMLNGSDFKSTFSLSQQDQATKLEEESKHVTLEPEPTRVNGANSATGRSHLSLIRNWFRSQRVPMTGRRMVQRS